MLGELLGDDVIHKDAIHVAIVPLTAAEKLKPGDRIRLDSGDREKARLAEDGDPAIGIVDPFLSITLDKYDRFYACLYPGTVTGMRHEWDHPAWWTEDSVAWLKDYAIRLSPYYDNPNEAYNRLCENLITGHIVCYGQVIQNLQDLPDAQQLKHHAERALNIIIDWDDFTFSCAC
jgi:hypothetical protein